MINYTLICKNCQNEFSSYFRSSDDYERCRNNNLILCPVCGSTNVDKHIMAPYVAPKSSSYRKNPKFKWVGERFVDEAIDMAEGKKESENISGYIKDEKDIEKLVDKGIDVVIVDFGKDDDEGTIH